MPVVGIAAYSATPDLIHLAADWPQARLVAADPGADPSVLAAHPGDVAVGAAAVTQLAGQAGAVVLNGIVGAAGLEASVAAVSAGNRLALANKESLVAGGDVLLAAASAHDAEIIPVDSEHSAVWQCLVGEPPDAVRRVILTASGGPFRGAGLEELRNVTPEQALAHPTWKMGRRISIDSATMLNKALEVIEVHHLFGVSYDQIAVVVHPQSVVHSLVEFVDGSVKAQIGEPDMRVPIQYAIAAPGRLPAPVAPLDLAGRSLTFEAPDEEVFPCLALGYAAGRAGGVAPAALNAADEVAVEAFLAHKIAFLDIPRVIESTLERMPREVPEDVAAVIAADGEARRIAKTVIARFAAR